MVGIVLGPHGEPVRRPGRTGESVRYLMQQPRTEPWQDALSGMVADLVRRFDPGGYQLQCPVAGCGVHWFVPRMELDPLEPLAGDDHVTHVEGVPREDVELVLRTHVDWHACLTETVSSWLSRAPADDWPLPPPPRWEQLEWCDDGGTCEHPDCLDRLHSAEDDAREDARREDQHWREWL